MTYLIRVPASAQSVELMLGVGNFSNNSATKCTRALGNQTSPRRPNCFMAVISEVIHKTTVGRISEYLRCDPCGFKSLLGINVAQSLIKLYELGELAKYVQL